MFLLVNFLYLCHLDNPVKFNNNFFLILICFNIEDIDAIKTFLLIYVFFIVFILPKVGISYLKPLPVAYKVMTSINSLFKKFITISIVISLVDILLISNYLGCSSRGVLEMF